MRDIFEPDEIAFADSRGDPNQAIEIQKLVKDLFEANPQRQEGILDEIVDCGAWAMPGLVNASYVWMDEFKKDSFSRKLVVDQMACLVEKNEAAADLLFRAGILDMTYPIPRKMAAEALLQTSWRPSDEIIQQIDLRLAVLERSGDIQSVVGLNLFVAQLGLENRFDSLLRWCCQLVEERSSQAADLLRAIKTSYTQHAEDILDAVVQAVNNAHTKGYKSQDLAQMTTTALNPIPAAWVEEGALLRVSKRILRTSSPPRNTVIEYLWIDAVKNLHREAPARWEKHLETIGSEMQAHDDRLPDDPASSLYRYWFRAVGNLNEVEYISNQARSDDELWGIEAMTQLFFVAGGYSRASAQARQALSDLSSELVQRYQIAEDRYQRLVSNNGKIPTTISQIQGPAGIRG
jgi:hypothetical protein